MSANAVHITRIKHRRSLSVNGIKMHIAEPLTN
jgi:hypothetical protein